MGLLVGFLFYQILNGPLNILITPNGSLRILEFLFKALVISILAAVFITDYKTGLIPDRISFPAIKIALVYLLTLTAYKIFLIYYSLQNSMIGKYLLPPHSDYFFRHSLIATEVLTSGIAAALLVGLFFAILIFVTRGRGMGGGDLKLGVFMGLALGVQNVILALMLAFFMGSIVGLGLLLTRRKKFGQTIPFGPFLTIGSLIALFWGEEIIRWYMRFNT
ncbi:MAG: Peptidase A24A domain protein [Candidatus Daviesbacteria bacterium GW2011_GWA1_38_7]|nr:MAG: Peptidase A24A domain protein [Candidatus Daviesbacteria bacterium GW2011_GWA1_38_7]